MEMDTIFLFPPFRLNASSGQLWRGRHPLALRPKTFAVLQQLVEQAGQVVTQADLLDAVWGPTAVSESVVRQSIRELRSILGDTAQQPQFIQTVHRRGYRFVAPVTVTNTPPSRAASTPEAPHTATHPAQPVPESAVPPTAPSLDEEYKLVTVLCCAVTDAPRLALQCGPEMMHHLMQGFFEMTQEAIQRYDGTIMYITGEDCTAVFGAPVGQEDHARRAVLAALDLAQHLRTQSFGETHAPKMGLHTGAVVIGGLTHAPQQPYTAVGETLHQAGHVQRLAPPGSILMSAATYKLVHEEVQGEVFGGLAADSSEELFPVYALHGLTQRRAGVVGQGGRYRSRFVGRERELALLHERLAYAAQGYGQVVGIGGEPGMGKSRLLAEFHRSLAGQSVGYREGHCLPYGGTTPYLPVCDLLRQGSGITEADAPQVIMAKVQRYLEEAQLKPEDDASLLLQLLGVPVVDGEQTRYSPQERKLQTFALMHHLVLHEAQRPLVLVVENLHWADATSEEWLTTLVEHLEGASILLLVTYRPGYRPPWLERSTATQLALPRLFPEDSRAVVESVLGSTVLPEGVLQAIVTQSDGNPFFLEELTWVVMEPGAAPAVLGLPNTIHAVLAARMDRLSPDEKRIMRTAAVIGAEIALPLLQALTEISEDTLHGALTHLQVLEMLYEKRCFPEVVYQFKHTLMQDVAYHSLLTERRQELHRQIGREIETLYVDRLAEYEERLAYHFSQAQEWDKALEYFLKAAPKAAQAFANREAITLYEHAEAMVEQLGEAAFINTLMAISRAKSDIYFVRSDFERSRAEDERLLTLAHRVGDRWREGMALAGMGWASSRAHDLDRAARYARRALAVAEAAEALQVQASGHFIISQVYAVTGRLDAAWEEANQALSKSRSDDVTDQRLSIWIPGVIKNWQGEYAEACRLFSGAMRLARKHRLLFPLLYTCFMYGITLIGKGDYDDALAVLQEGLALAEKVGDEVVRPRLLNCLGWLYTELGDFDRALDLNRQGAEEARKRGDPEIIANAELNLGDTLLTLGDLTLAQTYIEGVNRLVHDPATSERMKWRYTIRLFASLGELWLARGDLTAARTYAEQCLALATRTTSRKYLVRGWRLMGEIAIAHRQWKEAEGALRQALTLAQAIGNPTQLWKTYLAYGALYTATQQPERAQHVYGAAHDVLERVKSSLRDPGLRSSLELSPLMHHVHDRYGS